MFRRELKHGDVFQFADCLGLGWKIVNNYPLAPILNILENPRGLPESRTSYSGRMDDEVILESDYLKSKELKTSEPSQLDPPHYKDLTPEPVDVTEGWDLNPNLASVIWYIARAGKKKHTGDVNADAKIDLEKARRFLSREIARLDGRRAWE
jgi:hypothetical protein